MKQLNTQQHSIQAYFAEWLNCSLCLHTGKVCSHLDRKGSMKRVHIQCKKNLTLQRQNIWICAAFWTF